MLNIRFFVFMTAYLFALEQESVFAGRFEPVFEEELIVHAIKILNSLPESETVDYKGQTFVSGEVPGDGNCILHTLKVLFPYRNINREIYVDGLNQAFTRTHSNISYQELSNELANLLYYQMANQVINFGQKTDADYIGDRIEALTARIRNGFDVGRKEEYLRQIKADPEILFEVLSSLLSKNAYLSLSGDDHLLGTLGLACKLFKLNLVILTQGRNTDKCELRREFFFGGEELKPRYALFPTGGNHMVPLAHIEDAEMRIEIANRTRRMMEAHEGIYKTLVSDFGTQEEQ